MAINIEPFCKADAVVKLSLLLREVSITLSKKAWGGTVMENEIFQLQEEGFTVRYSERITRSFIVHVPHNYEIRATANEICRYLTEDKQMTTMRILEECPSPKEQIVEVF